jgi:RHS repeat-associated protein
LLAEAAYVVQACNATIRRDYNVTIGYGSNQVTPEGWYTIESGVLSAVPLGGQTSSAPCQETPVVINCETEGEVCAGAACVPCLPAEPVAPLCSGVELAALPQQLADLDQLMTQTGVNDLLFPIVLYRLRFCDGSRRYVFDRELGGIDAAYVMEQRLVVRSAADLFRLTYNNGASGQIGAVDVILSQRPGNNGLLITPLPPLQQSSAPGDPLSGDNPGNEGDGRPQVSYYNYDHLGNTRVVYHSVINCVSDSVHYVLEYAADYYPFGSILREWSNCEKSRFLFTYKERDAETGWDNLGARLYDSDIGRFFGVDPLAGKYVEWSSYAYVMNNPIILIDPTGASIHIAISGYQTDEEGNYILDAGGNKIAVSGVIKYTPGMRLIGNKFADAAIQTLNGLIDLGADPLDIIRTLANDDTNIVINEINWNEQNATSGGNIWWSPEGGLIHEDKIGRHSPAVSLLHELGHAYYLHYDPLGENQRQLDAINRGEIATYFEEELRSTGGERGFKGYEEMWVIKSVEHYAAKVLGQNRRSNHGKAGKYRAVSPFLTESLEELLYPTIKY